jgi:hypothetical protein
MRANWNARLRTRSKQRARYTRTNVEMAKSLLELGRYGDAIAILEPALRGSLEASNLYVTHTEIRAPTKDATGITVPGGVSSFQIAFM